jgi:hypothetical protein
VEDTDQGRQVETYTKVLLASKGAELLLMDFAEDLVEVGLHTKELCRLLDC